MEKIDTDCKQGNWASRLSLLVLESIIQFNANEKAIRFEFHCCASVSNRVFVQTLSYENEFDWYGTEPVGWSQLHVNGLVALFDTKAIGISEKMPFFAIPQNVRK